MSKGLSLVMFALGVYRLAILLTRESGPFDLIINARLRVQLSDLPDWAKEGVACPFCISFWLAVAPAVLSGEARGARLRWWLAIAGLTDMFLLIDKYLIQNQEEGYSDSATSSLVEGWMERTNKMMEKRMGYDDPSDGR